MQTSPSRHGVSRPPRYSLNRLPSTHSESGDFPMATSLLLLFQTGGTSTGGQHMAHFTQLGASANQDRKPEVKPQGKTLPNVPPDGQRPRSNDKRLDGKQRTAALIGSLIATALLGVFVLESGCSKESNKTAAIATPTQTVASQTPTPMVTAPAPAASQPPAKKKSRQRKLSASTYINPAYGVSFRYPKYDNLKEGDEAN